MSPKEENKKLIEAVLEWWEDHQHDTTGIYGECNVYDDVPEFVSIAKKLQQR